ncbi:BON domain-containing protein [Moraxella catarrhalis]|nr:BON domain-containing protein [Moraxella catarrhalis]MPX29213.1 BON domain-containing protein [Moraxella catarrhalis]RKL86341.1 BON domain-containing protein [Moraxella catarrhalis]RKL87982.1 BON domain-containing protein [Moraxella catarrhalis]RKL98580.1 BON domain-containing protein [Moraxella catarrhalis]
MMKKLLIVLTSMAMIGLTACASNGTQSIGADAMGRTIPERISDSSIELTARRNLATIPGVSPNTVRIDIASFRREVLLTGEVPSEQIKIEVGRTIDSMRDVEKVFNYLTVVETPKSQSHTLHENYLRSKINTRLLTNRHLKSSQYKVVVRDRTAYVLGYLTSEQQGYILEAIQATPGMEAAVTLTTLVSVQELENYTNHEVNTQAYTNDDGYDAVVAKPDTQEDSGYILQEIYTPNASNVAPANTAPVFEIYQ